MAATKKTTKKRTASRAVSRPPKDSMITGLTFLFMVLSFIFVGIACFYYI